MAKNVFVAMPAVDGGALNANENTIDVDLTNAEKASVVATGTFGGGTLTLHGSLDGTTFATTGLTLTAPGKLDVLIPLKKVRGVLTGATTPSVSVAIGIRTLDDI